MAFIRTSKTKALAEKSRRGRPVSVGSGFSSSLSKEAGEHTKYVSKEDADLKSWQSLPESERVKICMDDMAGSLKKEAEAKGKDVTDSSIRKTVVAAAETRDKQVKK